MYFLGHDWGQSRGKVISTYPVVDKGLNHFFYESGEMKTDSW